MVEEWEKEWKSKFQKAMGIYNKSLYSGRKPSVVIVSLQSDEQGDITINTSNKNVINSVKLNKWGQIISEGSIISPYNKPITAKKLENLNQAIKLYYESFELCPNELSGKNIFRKYSPLKWIGRIYQHIGLYDEAMDTYESALKIIPDTRKMEIEEIKHMVNECESQKSSGVFIKVQRADN